MGAQRLHLIGKEQEVGHVMAVRHVDVKPFAERFDAAHVGREVRQIGRKEVDGGSHGTLEIELRDVASAE